MRRSLSFAIYKTYFYAIISDFLIRVIGRLIMVITTLLSLHFYAAPDQDVLLFANTIFIYRVFVIIQ